MSCQQEYTTLIWAMIRSHSGLTVTHMILSWVSCTGKALEVLGDQVFFWGIESWPVWLDGIERDEPE